MSYKTFRLFLMEEEKCAIYSHQQLADLEKFADRLLEKFGLDIEFSKHFGERMSDTRNSPCIKLTELQQLFKKISRDKGQKIKQVEDAEAVLEDAQKNLNLPIVIFHKNGELEITLKTIMRKKNFSTSNQKVVYESH